MQAYYTIAIKRRFLPLWKKYKIIQHWCESSDIAIDGTPLTFPMRMVVKLPDRSIICIPKIAERTWRLYPCYEAFMAQVEAAKVKASSEETI